MEKKNSRQIDQVPYCPRKVAREFWEIRRIFQWKNLNYKKLRRVSNSFSIKSHSRKNSRSESAKKKDCLRLARSYIFGAQFRFDLLFARKFCSDLFARFRCWISGDFVELWWKKNSFFLFLMSVNSLCRKGFLVTLQAVASRGLLLGINDKGSIGVTDLLILRKSSSNVSLCMWNVRRNSILLTCIKYFWIWSSCKEF